MIRKIGLLSAIAVLVIAVGVFLGCGGGSRGGWSLGGAESAAEPMEEMRREAPAPRASKAADEPVPDDLFTELAEDSSGILATTTAVPQRPAERKRIYSGFCRLIVDEVEEAKADLTRFAEQNGGYVESAFENTIVLRVPPFVSASCSKRSSTGESSCTNPSKPLMQAITSGTSRSVWAPLNGLADGSTRF